MITKNSTCMTYTDEQLKRALAKLLPEQIFLVGEKLHWRATAEHCGRFALDTELLHICWAIEQTLSDSELDQYGEYLEASMDYMPKHLCFIRAPWQKRIPALAKIKGIEL